jgi:hypothetical protein
MSKYILLIYGNPKRWATIDPAEQGAIGAEYGALSQELYDNGTFVAGDPLQGIETAKTVAKGGVVTDGPFADVTEHLGGYYVVDVGSMDDALKLAGRLPGVDRGYDRIEVRPIMDFPGPT